MKIHWHDVPLYFTEIGYCFGNDVEQVNGFISKYAGEDISTEDASCCITLTAENGHKKYVIFLKDLEDSNGLAHEIFHATIRILRDRGALKEVMDDEQGAYLCGFLTDIAMKDIRKELKEGGSLSPKRTLPNV